MKNDYFSDEQTGFDARRKHKEKTGSVKSFFKGLLIAIGILVLFLVIVWAIIRFAFVDFYFSDVISQKQVGAFIDEAVMGRTETTVRPEIPTESTTVYESMTYLDSECFDLSDDEKGNFVGNIMNGGKACAGGGYAYHIVEGQGIYRFVPSTEDYALVMSTDHTISSLNTFGDTYYFVDENDNALCVASRNQSMTKIADNIISAYVYDGYAYCVSSFNQIMRIDVSTGSSRIIFSAKDNQKLSFVGLANDRVFFTLTDNNKTYYLSVDYSKNSLTAESFMEPSLNDSIKYLTLENAYMYYCVKQKNGTYNLVRQKFGSSNVITLVENENFVSYVTVDSNKVFYSCLNDDKLCYNEYNMNSKETKTMLKVSGVDKSNVPDSYHCGEYDFIIGNDVYIGSSNLTSSTRVMTFSSGYWKY